MRRTKSKGFFWNENITRKKGLNSRKRVENMLKILVLSETQNFVVYSSICCIPCHFLLLRVIILERLLINLLICFKGFLAEGCLAFFIGVYHHFIVIYNINVSNCSNPLA